MDCRNASAEVLPTTNRLTFHSFCANVERLAARMPAAMALRANLLCALLFCSAPGCSVYMAMEGREEPDLVAVEAGATRQTIERQLGQAISTRPRSGGGSYETYHYIVNDKPSTARAVKHGAMDVVTLGIWEAVATPMEMTQGETYGLEVEYDRDGRALTIRRIGLIAPVPLERPAGEQQSR